MLRGARIGLVLLCVGVLFVSVLRRGAAGQAPEETSQAATVRKIPPGQRFSASPGEKGATYDWLAGQTRRLTTRFANAVVTAERSADGDINSTVRDVVGRDLALLTVDHIDASSGIVRFRTDGAGVPFEALGEPGVRMNMDWANRQAYVFFMDGADADAGVEWRGGFIRRLGASTDFEQEIIELETEWADGISAVTSIKPPARRHAIGRVEFSGELVATVLIKDGQEAGRTNWFPREQAFTWNLPALTAGSITAKQLEKFGGWPFQPDLEWMNIQAIAFHHFKAIINKKRFVALQTPNWLERALQYVAPSLDANEPGCDGLHWLDDTILRFCCDMHDACYEKHGCTASTWWKVWTSWSCNRCNGEAVWCFTHGGLPFVY